MRGRPVWPQSLALLTIAACTPANEIARQGRQLVIGMDASTLQSCAGIPTRIAQLDPRTQLYSYENKYERTGGSRSRCRSSAAGSGGRQRLLLSCPGPHRRRQGGRRHLYRRQRRHDRPGGRVRPDLPRLPAGAGESARGAHSRGGLTVGRLVGRRAERRAPPLAGHPHRKPTRVAPSGGLRRGWPKGRGRTRPKQRCRSRRGYVSSAGIPEASVRVRATPQPVAYESPLQQAPQRPRPSGTIHECRSGRSSCPMTTPSRATSTAATTATVPR